MTVQKVLTQRCHKVKGPLRGRNFVGNLMVEAAGVEPASENANNREHSCFSRIHLVSPHALRTGKDVRGASLIDLVYPAQAVQGRTSLLCDAPYRPVGEA